MSTSVTSRVQRVYGDVEQLAQRVDGQLGFARSLIELQPGRRRMIERAVMDAEEVARRVFADNDGSRVREGISEIERALLPAAELAKQYTIYCVGHAHIDMNWMWGWQETVAVVNDTFGTVLQLMEEFPDFIFSQSQASVYAIMQQYNPELFEAIRQKVKEGRWEVTASAWVEGDRNMVGGESLTRDLLYTRRYFKEHFGLEAEEVQIDWSPDTFGHPITVPMYLNKGGVKYVYLHRPGGLGPKRPGSFWWESPDGSKVLVVNDMIEAYNGQLNPDVIKPLVRSCKETGLKFDMFVYGVGDHGGGPTRRDLAMAKEMDCWPVFPNIKFSKAAEFYARLEREGSRLPTLRCELNTEVAGCYTTQALIKRSNRLAEHRLLDAEAACVVASKVAGVRCATSDMELAWRDALFVHFHDILPGSNVADSRHWALGLFQKTMASANMIETLALRGLAKGVDTSGGAGGDATSAVSRRATLGAGVGSGSERNCLSQPDLAGGPVKPLVIFNPCAWPREEIVEATLWSDVLASQITEEIRNRPISVRTPEGALIPAQKIEHGVAWGHAFVRVAFPVKVSGLGYATYTVVEQSCDAAAQKARQITAPHHCFYLMEERRKEGLKNEFLEVRIDPETGGVASLLDLRSGMNWRGPWQLEYLLEKPHRMSSWLIDNAVKRESPQVLAIDRQLDDGYKASVDVRLKIRESEFTLRYELRAGEPVLYMHLKGTWFERGTPQIGVPTLRFTMPLSDLDTAPRGTYEIPFGAIERETRDGEEVPALNWAMVSGVRGGKPAGLLLLNDCKHGHAVDQKVFNLTLIRSAYDPDPLSDIGQHEAQLAIRPFVGAFAVDEAMRSGKNFNRPLRVVSTSVHSGSMPRAQFGISVTGGGVVLTDVKRSEDGKGTICYLTNVTAAWKTATIRFNPELFGDLGMAEEVDLMERALPERSLNIRGNAVKVRIRGNSLVAVKLGNA